MNKELTSRRNPLAVVLGVVLVAIFLAGLSAGLDFVAHPQVTYAGSNGQMLDIVCNGATQVSIVGVNQNGDPVQQTILYPAPTSDGLMHFYTDYFWYKGSVAITWTDANGTPTVYHDSVPVSQASDHYVSDCRNPPASDYGTSAYDCDPGLTSDPQVVANCLALAPIPAGCSDCQPYLDEVVLQSQGSIGACVMEGGTYDLWGYPVPVNPAGLANIYTRYYGFSYQGSNPFFSGQAWYSGGTGPLYIIGSSLQSYSCLA